MLRRLFDNWEKDILRPIVVSLATALCLFLVSLVFAPVRKFFFPPGGDPTYPVYCIFEPYRSPADAKKLNVDLFIINRSPDAVSRDQLISHLRSGPAEQSAALGPDLHLRYARKAGLRSIGRVESAGLEQGEFNRDKGVIDVRLEDNDVQITIHYLAGRAIMKVTIVVAGLPDIDAGAAISRMMKEKAPFEYERYQIACHER